MSRSSSQDHSDGQSSTNEEMNDKEDGGGPSHSTSEKLVDYLLASKRSLAFTSNVWRANEIVTAARNALEESVIIGARTSFLREGIRGQVRLLRQIKQRMDGVARAGQTEFDMILRDLDAVDAALQRTLDQLESTAVPASLRPSGEEPKTLLDFVEQEGVNNVKAGIRESIDQTQEARRDFESSTLTFDNNLQALQDALSPSSGSTPASTDVEAESPIPALLFSLESQAKGLAESLESLVRHFDLCVKAIKHTEGGGAAAHSIVGDLPDEVDVDRVLDEAPIEEISDEDMAEMLHVLDTDAADLEDVVMEMKDGLGEMESQLVSVTSHVDHLTNGYAAATDAFQMLEGIGTRLSDHVASSDDFLTRWDEEKRKIEERMEELHSLSEFYEGFSKAYDGLLIEIGRRRAVQSKMQAIIKDAMVKVDQLSKGKFHMIIDSDLNDRDAFRQEQGEFLPSDIWPGLTNPPLRFDVVSINPEEGAVPDLPAKLIEQALRRSGVKL